MTRKIRLWYICGIVALGLFVPSLMLGQEIPGARQTEMNIPTQAPEQDISLDKKPMTLEELKKLLGPKNVCGAPCYLGVGRPTCGELCGDYSTACWDGFCIYL